VFDRTELTDLGPTAREAGVMFSHLFRVDGTHLGSIRHEDPEPFFAA